MKIALRNFQRQKGYSFINIAGLTLGLACFLLIFQYVAFAYSFDTFNENADDLYRVINSEVQEGGTVDTESTFGWAFGPALAEEVPEVVRYARLHPEYDNAVIVNPAQPDKAFEEKRVYYADPSFFDTLVGLIRLLIALLTVSYQSIKAALADPVKSLRYE